MRWVAVLCLVLLGSACERSNEAPSVDWQQIPHSQRASIDRVVGAGDCAGMQAAFDGSSNGDVLAYLDWHMRDTGC